MAILGWLVVLKRKSFINCAGVGAFILGSDGLRETGLSDGGRSLNRLWVLCVSFFILSLKYPPPERAGRGVTFKDYLFFLASLLSSFSLAAHRCP